MQLEQQESPAIADKPARRESLPKLLQFDGPTTLSLTILAYLHAFNCYCVRNPRNPEKFTENSNLWSSRSSKVIDLGVNRKPICDLLLVTNSNFHRRRLPGCRGCQCTHRKRVGGCMHPEQKLMNLLFIGYIFSFNPVRFLPARRYARAGLCLCNSNVYPSFHPSVRHEPVLYQNEEILRHYFFIIW